MAKGASDRRRFTSDWDEIASTVVLILVCFTHEGLVLLQGLLNLFEV